MTSSGSEKAAPPPASKMSALERRRNNKPIMEKKRRQRINNCLNDLKTLVLEGLNKDPTRHNKLEKADILEMTVRHVQTLHRREASMRLQNNAATKYCAGFTQCANEVSQFLSAEPLLTTEIRTRLLLHLANILTSTTSKNKNKTDVKPSPPPKQQQNENPSPGPMETLILGETPLLRTTVCQRPIAFVLPAGTTPCVKSDPAQHSGGSPSPPSTPPSPTRRVPSPAMAVSMCSPYQLGAMEASTSAQTSTSSNDLSAVPGCSPLSAYPVHPSPPRHPYTPPPASSSPCSSMSEYPDSPRYCRSPSPQPLDLAPVRDQQHLEEQPWRPW